MLALATREGRGLTEAEAAELQLHLDACASCHAVAHQSEITARERPDDLMGDTIQAASDPAASGAAEPLRGQSIGRFLVLDLLGSGGMGVVYSGYDPDLDRKVAIKLLRASALRTDDNQTRLLREAQAMARIKHPNVIKVHEVGTYNGQVYVAMEFADAGTVRAWMEEKARSPREILAVFLEAGRGLAAAHAAGLVHRDFKPDNVLMSKDGSVLVTDFGLVSSLAGAQPVQPDKPLSRTTPLSQELTHTGAILGTPAYMAPEQFAGEATARSDQFGFCVSLYEALYGARPFEGKSYVELSARVSLGEITAAPKATAVPSWMRRVLLRGLAVAPSTRFASMNEAHERADPRSRAPPAPLDRGCDRGGRGGCGDDARARIECERGV